MREGLTQGLHCKACDAPLSGDIKDPELCGVCYEAVVSMNRKLYEQLENKSLEQLIERGDVCPSYLYNTDTEDTLERRFDITTQSVEIPEDDFT